MNAGRSVPGTERQRFKMVAAATVSLLVHTALAWSVYDKSLSPLLSTESGDEQRVYHVRRADPDLPIERDITSTSHALIEPVGSKLHQLSSQLLDKLAASTNEERAGPTLVIREVPDDPAPDSGPPPPIAPPSTLKPVPLIEQLKGQLTLAVPFVESQETVSVTETLRVPTTLGSGGLAQTILTDIPLVGTNPPVPNRSAAPITFEIAPAERRDLGSAPAPPPIDWRPIVLKDVTRLKAPEYLDDDFEYMLYVYEPPQRWLRRGEKAHGYFRVDISGRRSLRKLRAMPKDIVFLIDTSGSVTQPWVRAIVRGVQDALSSLNQDDRFNIVMFKETATLFSPQAIQPVNDHTLAAARAFMTEAQAGGFTDVNRALNRLLVRDLQIQRVYDLILISDGRPTRGIRDTRELINLITRDNDLSASIYCVGIGNRQNHPLLEFLAYRNKGLCKFARSSDATPNVIRDLVSTLRYPIIKDVAVNVGGLVLGEVVPRHVPNIHQGQTFSVYGRFEKAAQFMVQISGLNHSQKVAFKMRRHLARANRGDESIAKSWAFSKYFDLYSERLRRGDDQKYKQQMDWLRKRYKLKPFDPD